MKSGQEDSEFVCKRKIELKILSQSSSFSAGSTDVHVQLVGLNEEQHNETMTQMPLDKTNQKQASDLGNQDEFDFRDLPIEI